MRHGKKFNHLGRTASHRNAMLANMASSLIENKRITTTVAKAKALRKYVEPLLTKSKDNTTHSRRVVFSYLQNKYAVQTLFDEVAARIADRPGGYTRIIKMGSRLGDNAEMALIELVDYNELLIKEDKPAKAKTRRSRRGGASKTKQEEAPVVEAAEQVEAEVVEETAPETEVDVEEPENTVEDAEVAADDSQGSVEEVAAEESAVATEAEPEAVVEEEPEAVAVESETVTEEAAPEEEVVAEASEAVVEEVGEVVAEESPEAVAEAPDSTEGSAREDEGDEDPDSKEKES